MIPIKEYLSIRISHTIYLLISIINNTEIFIGSENQMLIFYNSLGYKRIAHLITNSSLQYYLFNSIKNKNNFKIIIIGAGNETRLNHLLLQLKLGGIDINKIIIRGSMKDALFNNKKELYNIMQNLPNNIDTVFMGNRSLILLEFVKKYYPNEMNSISNNNENDEKKIAEKILKENHNLKTYEIGDGVYKFSYFEMKIKIETPVLIKKHKIGIICFRMPNGNLARIATQALIQKGIHHFIMLGAGGSLNNESQMGCYQLIKSTSYNNKDNINILNLDIKQMNIDFSKIPILYQNGNNITVDSPLIETRNWLNKVKNEMFTCVDVETYHIIKGIENCRNIINNIEILSGIFISDIVGDCPLVEKIKSRNTWKYLPEFLNICFEYIIKQIKNNNNKNE